MSLPVEQTFEIAENKMLQRVEMKILLQRLVVVSSVLFNCKFELTCRLQTVPFLEKMYLRTESSYVGLQSSVLTLTLTCYIFER